MENSVAILFGVMFTLLFLGVPIGVSIACAMLALIHFAPITKLTFIAQSLYSGLDNFTLLSLPFFMIAGTIMEGGGISRRIVKAANSAIGNVTGSLGMVSIIACMFFGAVSGSAIATVAAIGSIMLPAMDQEGYNRTYATALIAVAGSLGMIVPPSTPMVVYGVTNNVSIGALFMGGFLPAMVVGGLLMTVNYFTCKKYGWVGKNHRLSGKEIAKTFWDAKWALMMPVIILGGIYSGVVTPTEASVVGCSYGIIVGRFIYKELTWRNIWEMYKKNTSFIGAMLFTFAPAGALSAIFAYMKIPAKITAFFISISSNPYVILFMILILLLIVGMFLETTPSMLLISPILLAVVQEIGVHPVHFGIFMVLALCVGLVTPPVAMDLFVAQSMTGIDMISIARTGKWLILSMIAATLIILYVPWISLVLPKLFSMIR